MGDDDRNVRCEHRILHRESQRSDERVDALLNDMVYHCGIRSEKVHAEPPLGDALSLDEPRHEELGDDDLQLVREGAVQVHDAVQAQVHGAVRPKDEVPVRLVFDAVSQALCAELPQLGENPYCLAYLPPRIEADVVAPFDDEKVQVHDLHDYAAHYHLVPYYYYVVGSH